MYAMAGRDDEAMPDERAFDEFHLYTLPRPVLLRNNELKQVEFIRAAGVKGTRTYVYNPLVGFRYYGGRQRGSRLWHHRPTRRSACASRSRTARRTSSACRCPRAACACIAPTRWMAAASSPARTMMDHLPKNELLKLDMGNAFDLVGERKRVDFKVDSTAKRMTESFEIKLRNRKETPVEIRVVEPLVSLRQLEDPATEPAVREIRFAHDRIPRAGAGGRRNGADVYGALLVVGKVFHTVETFFPWCGKIAKTFSIAWKNRFSMVWEKFSSVEELEGT